MPYSFNVSESKDERKLRITCGPTQNNFTNHQAPCLDFIGISIGFCEFEADLGMYAGQLKWRWFQNDRSLQDVVTFDAATRGPLGSLSLLWALRLQHPLASCGALITILMLAIDPFTQQMIRYYNCTLPVDKYRATIPRTNLYRAVAADGNFYGASQASTDHGLLAAINAGIFAPGNLVAPSCPTGNCSFPQPYSTVAYCSSCEDLSHSLVVTSVSSASFSKVAPLAPNQSTDFSLYLPSGTYINTSTLSLSSMTNVATMNFTSNKSMEFIFVPNPNNVPRGDLIGHGYNNSIACQKSGNVS